MILFYSHHGLKVLTHVPARGATSGCDILRIGGVLSLRMWKVSPPDPKFFPKVKNKDLTPNPPSIMIKFVLQNLAKLKFRDEDVITTLERRMKCGIGLCGRCNLGSKYVCKDGPVFSLAQLKELPEE
jgi:hypothetical protein